MAGSNKFLLHNRNTRNTKNQYDLTDLHVTKFRFAFQFQAILFEINVVHIL